MGYDWKPCEAVNRGLKAAYILRLQACPQAFKFKSVKQFPF
jgi:hypothetical protein